jgi:hypothetical protein
MARVNLVDLHRVDSRRSKTRIRRSSLRVSVSHPRHDDGAGVEVLVDEVEADLGQFRLGVGFRIQRKAVTPGWQ